MSRLLALSLSGLYFEAVDFHIDPWQPAERALHRRQAGWPSEGATAVGLATHFEGEQGAAERRAPA